MTTATLSIREKIADPDTPEWLAARSTGIGASEAAAAAGLSDWATPLDIYLRKRGELPDVPDNEAMRMGRRLEPIVVEEFSLATGLPVTQYPMGMFRHPSLPFVLATPDAQVAEVDGLEAKTSTWRVRKRVGEEGTDALPPEWVCQCQQQMAVVGFARVHVALLIDGRHLSRFVVERDDDLIDGLTAAESELWERIQDGRPPEFNWQHARAAELVKQLFGSIGDTRIVELSADATAAWTRRQELQEEINRLKKESDSAKAKVLYEIGEFAGGILPDGSQIIRRSERAECEVSYVRKAYIDVRAGKPRRDELSNIAPRVADDRESEIPNEGVGES